MTCFWCSREMEPVVSQMTGNSYCPNCATVVARDLLARRRVPLEPEAMTAAIGRDKEA